MTVTNRSKPGSWTDRLRDNLRNLDPVVASLSHYELQDKIGEGGMGVVFRAVDRRLQRPVAIKILKESAHAQEAARARFRREAQAAASINHPNVVSVHDVGEADGCLFLVMEMVEGEPLAALLARKKKPPLSDRLRWVARAALGVSAAHERGIIHRDLKPANLLITPQGECKVADFGVAHIVGSRTGLTRTGAALGTPLYMAPEQIEGDPRKISTATDVYALGSILYEVTTGRPPHPGETILEIYSRIRNQDPVPPRRLNPVLHRDLETLILKALDKDPTRRYPDAGALATDLHRFLNGEPVLARPVSAPIRILRRAFRRGPLIPLGAAALLVGTVLTAMALVRSAESGKATREAMQRANALETEGRIEEADAIYSSLLRSDPNLPGLREASKRTGQKVAAKAAALNAQSEAINLLDLAQQALAGAENFLYHEESDNAEMLRKVEAAQGFAGQALEKSPHLPLAHDLLGRCWDLRGWDDKAEECWRKAIELKADYPQAHFRLGRLLMQRSLLASHTRNSRSLDPGRTRSHLLLTEAAGEIEKAIGAGEAFHDDLTRHLLGTLQAWLERENDLLRERAEEGVRRFAGRPGVEEFHWMAALLTDASDPANTVPLEHLRRALEIRPKYPLAYFLRSTFHRGNRKYDEAIRDLTRAIEYSPRFALAWLNRGGNRHDSGDAEGALSDYNEALKIRPGLPEAHYNRANLHRERGDWDKARADYDAALAADPNYADALTNRGSLRQGMGDRLGAGKDYDRAIELDPGQANAFINRGTLRHAQGQNEKAIEDYDEALRQVPHHADAWFNRAEARLSLGDFDGALEDYTQTLKIKPTDMGARLQRAMVYAREKRDFKKAIGDCNQVITTHPNAPEPWLMRAQIRRAAGATELAIEDLERALVLAPANWTFRAGAELLLQKIREEKPALEAHRP